MRRRLNLLPLLTVLLAGLLTAGCVDQPSPFDPAGPPETELTGSVLPLSGTLGGRLSLLQAPGEIPLDSASAVIGPEGGLLEIPGGHRIHFPTGALDEATEIRARVGGGRTLKVTFAPHGLEFPALSRPVLEMSYADAGLLRTLSRLSIVYVDDRERILEVWLGVPNPFRQTITTSIGHFSAYAIASN